MVLQEAAIITPASLSQLVGLAAMSPAGVVGVVLSGVLVGAFAGWALLPRRAPDSQALEAMVAQRAAARHHELEAARHRMMLILHAAGEGIYGIDGAGKITFCNPAALAMLGHAHEAEVFRRSAHELHHHHHADGAPYLAQECPVYETLRTGQVGAHDGDVFWRKDGSSFPVEFHSTPVNIEGKITGAVVVFRDITKRLAREEELRQSNHDLDVFATAASHDLQAPLRQIRSFADLLKQPGLSPAESKQYLEAVTDSAARMQDIIRSLLTYSRRANRHPDMDAVALSKVVMDVLAVVQEPLDEVGATVDVGALPVVRGDVARLFQVFQNLIQNSIRYRAEGRPLHIAISWEVVGAHHRITVKDNGVGFDNAQAERIFQMFERLHGRSKAGVGLGLAIVRRSLEQHGGSIRAVGEPDVGATFIIELPRVVG